MTQISKPDWLKKPDLYTPQAEANSDVPHYTIPGNKVLSVDPKVNGYSPNALIGKGGITHVQDTYADPSLQINWLTAGLMANSGKGVQSPYGTHGFTYQDMVNVMNTIPCTPISMDEFLEGNYGMPVDCPELVYAYQALKAKYDAQGKTLRHGGTYGSFGIGQPNYWNYFTFTGGSQTNVITQDFKNVLLTQAGSRSISNQHFQVFAPIGIGANIKNYVDRPDYAQVAYLKIFETEALCNGYGRVGGVGGNAPFLVYVDWQKIEGLGGTHLHNGMRPSRRVESPAGWVDGTEDEHPIVDYDWRVALQLICGFMFMDGCIQFDDPYRHGTNPLVKGNSQTWTPDVTGTAFPSSVDDSNVFNNAFFKDQYRGHDSGVNAGYYYSQMASTEGERWSHVGYQFQGSQDWIMPQTDGGPDIGPTTTILYRAQMFDGPYARGQNVRRGGPIVYVRKKNAIAHYVAFDPSLPKYKRETITIQVTPSKTEQITLQGSVAYVGTTSI